MGCSKKRGRSSSASSSGCTRSTKAVDLPGELYDRLSGYAKREEVTLAVAIQKLLDAAE